MINLCIVDIIVIGSYQFLYLNCEIHTLFFFSICLMFCVSGVGIPSGLDSPCGDGDRDKCVSASRDGDGERGIFREAGAKRSAYPRWGWPRCHLELTGMSPKSLCVLW